MFLVYYTVFRYSKVLDVSPFIIFKHLDDYVIEQISLPRIFINNQYDDFIFW